MGSAFDRLKGLLAEYARSDDDSVKLVQQVRCPDKYEDNDKEDGDIP